MIDVALLSIIRRWHLRDQVSLREIAKRLGVSRNTVRKYLRTDTTEPNYSTRRTPSALDSYAFKLSVWLKTEANKPRKQRRTLKQIHADLCSLGFNGSYDRVAEALFIIAGARCISLGTRTPMLEIVDAAARHGVDCVALSFSASFPARQGSQQVRELRSLLPESIEIWVGGGGAAAIQLPAGVFSAIPPGSPEELVAEWHRRRTG